MIVWLWGCGGPKAPVDALPEPVVYAQPAGRGEAAEGEPTLTPWVISYAPPKGPLALTWRPGPEPDLLEIELDASRLPEAVEYTVEVYETHRPVIGEPLEQVEYVEGPFPVSEPWRVRPRGGVPPTLDSISLQFEVSARDGTLAIIATSAFFYHSVSLGSIVALDPILAVRDFQRRRAQDPTLAPLDSIPLGQPGDDFLLPPEQP